MIDVQVRQASDRGLLLQRAADGSHRQAYRIERARILGSVGFALAAVVATLLPKVAPAVATAGAVWALLSLLLSGASHRENRAAAVVQQQFDTWLFEMPWEAYAGARLGDEELHRRARRSTLEEQRMKTWYPDVTGLPDVYGVLACQRENLAWDGRLRRRWANILTAWTSSWVAVGLLIALLADLSVRTISLRWYVPSVSMVVLAVQMARAHREIASEKEQLMTLVRAELEGVGPGDPDPSDVPTLQERCREVQRRIFELRRRSERVPRRLYEWYRDEDEADMRATVAGLRQQLGI